jgi:twitching motility two-component system response regulator PilH
MAKILVVDDMQAELELICQYLTTAGHTTVTASNGEEALHEAQENRPDVIVTDWMMPVMGGLDREHLNCATSTIVRCDIRNSESKLRR